nr:hypothetical protein BaRGS_014498 [Batillaria attramentaria]
MMARQAPQTSLHVDLNRYAIESDDFFQNVSDFMGFDLSGNGLSYISDSSFRRVLCLLSRGTYTFTMVVIAMVIFAMTLGFGLYRYRWHIRLVLYEAYRGRGDRWRRLQEHDFQYDVFVSYASEDEEWVQAHLLPELEGRWGLRLCTHERDFIPGKNIIENIQDCLETSKKVMMLFSSDFARSQWCQMELAMCMTHVIENDDALILVRLREIPSRDLTSAMMAVMKTTTYIEWEDMPEVRASFWGRIRIALQEIMQGVRLP